MKKNILILLSLVAFGGSIYAMQADMDEFMELAREEYEVNVSDRTKQLKDQLKNCQTGSSSEKCKGIAAATMNSWLSDFKGMKECQNLAPLNFQAFEKRCRKSVNNNEKIACFLNTLEPKLELLDLCLRAQANENKK